MKLLYTFLTLFVYSQFSLAQKTSEVEWTEMLDIKKSEIYGQKEIIMDTPSHLLGEINGVLVYKSHDFLYGIKDGKIIYQHKTKIVFYDGERIEVFQNRLLYFSIKKRNIFLTEHDLETGEPLTEPIQLTNDLPEKDFYIRTQKNEDFLALNLHYGSPVLSESSRCFHYVVINADLKVAHSNEVMDPKKEGKHLPILIDDGRVLVFNKAKNDNYFKFKIHSADETVEGQFNIPKGTQEKQELQNDPELFLQSDGKIKGYWTFMDSEKRFSPTKSKRTFTVTSFIIDRNGDISGTKMSSPFLAYPSKIKQNGALNTEANRYDYRQRKGHLLEEEGGYIGLAENEWVRSSTSSNGVTKNSLFLYDIYVYKLDKEGDLEWSHKIRKRHQNFMNYSSIVSFISGDDLVILFNDVPGNYKDGVFNVPEDKILESPGFKKTGLAMVRINIETGDLTRTLIQQNENYSMFIKPTDHYISDDKIQILSGGKSKTRILSINI